MFYVSIFTASQRASLLSGVQRSAGVVDETMTGETRRTPNHGGDLHIDLLMTRNRTSIQRMYGDASSDRSKSIIWSA